MHPREHGKHSRHRPSGRISTGQQPTGCRARQPAATCVSAHEMYSFDLQYRLRCCKDTILTENNQIYLPGKAIRCPQRRQAAGSMRSPPPTPDPPPTPPRGRVPSRLSGFSHRSHRTHRFFLKLESISYLSALTSQFSAVMLPTDFHRFKRFLELSMTDSDLISVRSV